MPYMVNFSNEKATYKKGAQPGNVTFIPVTIATVLSTRHLDQQTKKGLCGPLVFNGDSLGT